MAKAERTARKDKGPTLQVPMDKEKIHALKMLAMSRHQTLMQFVNELVEQALSASSPPPAPEKKKGKGK